MAAWWRLLLIVLAALERTSSQHQQTFQTEPEYVALGYFKKSQKLLNTVLNHDYQETVQDLVRANRDYPDLARGFHRRDDRKMFDDELGEDYQQSIDSLSSMIGKRRVRSQRMRREKLNLQGVRSHRAHSLESGRRRRLQPDSKFEEQY